MSPTPAPDDGGRPWPGSPDWTLVPQSPDWDQDYLAVPATEDGYPDDLEEYEDPDNAPPAGLDDAELAALIAEAFAFTGDGAGAEMGRAGQRGLRAALGAMAGGRRGPGMPGSEDVFPPRDGSPAAGFASGLPLDTAAGCAVLGSFLDDAARDDDRYAGASDDELLGVICAWDRVEANASARKHAAVAELFRRRPAPGAEVTGPAQMPGACDEFTGRELGAVLGVSGGEAEEMLGLAWQLEVCLPGTKAAFRTGIVSRDKAAVIAWATALLDPAEARAAEGMVLDRAGRLTPGQLRAAIKRAVMAVNPDKARKRREHAAKQARVERWTEHSGNAGLAGRELSPAQVLAADQRLTAWAEELRKAGLEGGMDQLRVRALMDILLGVDSRPRAVPRPEGTGDGGSDGPGRPNGLGGPGRPEGPDGPGRPEGPGGLFGPPDPAGGPLAGLIPPGFAARVNLTIPATTVLDRAARAGELAGTWPIDPDLARDLAAAAARSSRSTWCVTVTDSLGHAIGHGCARPAPASTPKRPKPDTNGGPDPPGGPSFTFTPADEPGPPGGYGTWRFSTGIPGQRDMIVKLEPIPTGDCDHRHEAKGHDPGVKLRHLTQVRYATCTGPGCGRPSTRADFEHNIPYEAGGRTCTCNCDPKCRFDHRLKQDPRWKAEHLPSGAVRWTTPSGRQWVTEPTRYPI
jgi:uncharacterized protein DUF222